MERILIYKNEEKISDAKQRINNDLIPAVQNIINAYLALDLGNFTQSVWKDLNNSAQFCYTMTEKYSEKIEAALRETGLRGSVLTKLVNGSLVDIEPVKNAYNNLQDLPRETLLLLSYVTFEGNKANMNAENLKRLEEENSQYINTEAEKALFDAQKAVVDGLNALLTHFENRVPIGNTKLFITDALLKVDVDTNRVEINPLRFDLPVES